MGWQVLAFWSDTTIVWQCPFNTPFPNSTYVPQPNALLFLKDTMAYILNVIHTNVPALQYKQKQLECDQLSYQAHLILQKLPDAKFHYKLNQIEEG